MSQLVNLNHIRYKGLADRARQAKAARKKTPVIIVYDRAAGVGAIPPNLNQKVNK